MNNNNKVTPKLPPVNYKIAADPRLIDYISISWDGSRASKLKLASELRVSESTIHYHLVQKGFITPTRRIKAGKKRKVKN